MIKLRFLRSQRGAIFALLEATIAAGILAFVAAHVLLQFLTLSQQIDQNVNHIKATQQVFTMNEALQAEVTKTPGRDWEAWLNTFYQGTNDGPLPGNNIWVTTTYNATYDITYYTIHYEYDHRGQTHHVEISDAYTGS